MSAFRPRRSLKLYQAIAELETGRDWQRHDYTPDFIVRLKDEQKTHLILETKGWDPLAEVKIAAANRWVAAVNADGSFGVWRYEIARKVDEVKAILDATAKARSLIGVGV